MRVEIVASDRWAEHVAELWAQRLTVDPGLRMCLAAGATPIPVFAEMVRRVGVGEVSFAGSQVFALDEYVGLPPGHEVRCDSMLRRDLIEGIDLPESGLHLFDVDAATLDAVGGAYDQAIADRGGLDLAVLGLGRNGHLGMNEPRSPFDAPTRLVELSKDTREGARRYGSLDTPPVHGVTLGLGPLLDAGEIWLLVTGEAKAGILAEVVEGPVTVEVPATCLQGHPGALVLADEPAASELHLPPL